MIRIHVPLVPDYKQSRPWFRGTTMPNLCHASYQSGTATQSDLTPLPISRYSLHSLKTQHTTAPRLIHTREDRCLCYSGTTMLWLLGPSRAMQYTLMQIHPAHPTRDRTRPKFRSSDRPPQNDRKRKSAGSLGRCFVSFQKQH